MQRVHPDRVAGRLDVGSLARCLHHAQLRLELDDVPTKRVERIANAVSVIALLRDGQVLDTRK